MAEGLSQVSFFMALYKKRESVKRFPSIARGDEHYETIAAQALENSIEHLNHAYKQKLCGAEGAVEFRDGGVYTYDNTDKRYLDCSAATVSST